MVPVEAAASVVLLEFQSSYGLGFVAPNGRVVTSFHVVSDEEDILVHMADGRALPAKGVAALDVKRDLAVLDLGELDVPPVDPAGSRLAADGAPAFVFGMVPEEGRARWVESKIIAVQVLGPSLTVYRLDGQLPRDASGGPLVATDGRVLGVVTVADSDEGIVTLGIPWRYVEPLLSLDQALPLSSLQDTRKKPPKRMVPEHPLSLLEGSSVKGLEAATDAIGSAIKVGAPAYNEGDVATCYQVYADCAREVIADRADCPGVQTVLRDGLDRAASLGDVDQQAWAMRDAFDGLLAVIDRFFKAHFAQARKPGKPTLMN